jgi:hypothetical protein
MGRFCNASCIRVGCADPNDDARITSGDALFVLNSAVGLVVCDACLCDADSSGQTTAADALRVLRAAVGLPVEIVCSACP